MQINIPAIRSRDELHDAVGNLLSRMNEDELASIAVRIFNGDYGWQSGAFCDHFLESSRALEDAAKEWDRRDDPLGEKA